MSDDKHTYGITDIETTGLPKGGVSSGEVRDGEYYLADLEESKNRLRMSR